MDKASYNDTLIVLHPQQQYNFTCLAPFFKTIIDRTNLDIIEEQAYILAYNMSCLAVPSRNLPIKALFLVCPPIMAKGVFRKNNNLEKIIMSIKAPTIVFHSNLENLAYYKAIADIIDKSRMVYNIIINAPATDIINCHEQLVSAIKAYVKH